MQHEQVSTSTRAGGGLDPRWRALAARDRSADGTFVYAVTSTGVYCRPSCPSRRPRADRVRFFDSGVDARAAGYRSCRRCRPDQVDLGVPGMDAVRRVSAWLAAHADEPVTLARLGRLAKMSPHHLQRPSPPSSGCRPASSRRRVAPSSARQPAGGADVTRAIYEAGYGREPGLRGGVTQGVTPSVYRRHGAGWRSLFARGEPARPAAGGDDGGGCLRGEAGRLRRGADAGAS